MFVSQDLHVITKQLKFLLTLIIWTLVKVLTWTEAALVVVKVRKGVLQQVIVVVAAVTPHPVKVTVIKCFLSVWKYLGMKGNGAALFPWRHAAEQQAPAADRPEVCWQQLRHRLRRLPHLHRPSGEHVQYVKEIHNNCIIASRWSQERFIGAKINFQSVIFHFVLTESLSLNQELSRLWTKPTGDVWTWTSCR